MAIEFALLNQEEKLTGTPMASAYYQVKRAAELNGLDFLATKYSQLTIAEQFGDGYSQAMKLEDKQAKNQETQDEAEGRAKNQRAEDENRLQLSLGPEAAVINEVGEVAIRLPMQLFIFTITSKNPPLNRLRWNFPPPSLLSGFSAFRNT